MRKSNVTSITPEAWELSPAEHGHEPEEHFKCQSQIETESKNALQKKKIIKVNRRSSNPYLTFGEKLVEQRASLPQGHVKCGKLLETVKVTDVSSEERNQFQRFIDWIKKPELRTARQWSNTHFQPRILTLHYKDLYSNKAFKKCISKFIAFFHLCELTYAHTIQSRTMTIKNLFISLGSKSLGDKSEKSVVASQNKLVFQKGKVDRSSRKMQLTQWRTSSPGFSSYCLERSLVFIPVV